MDKIYRWLAWTVLVVGILIGTARATAVRWWQVPLDDPELSASLAPTLRAGDWVLLWRLGAPGLGDLVLCPDPDDPTNVVIGRVAGESGTEVTLHGQVLEIDGERPEQEYNCTKRTFQVEDPETETEEEIHCEMENLHGKLHARGFNNKRRRRRKFHKQVEPGDFFLVSDNRAMPFDSRDYGTLDRRSCKETVFFRLVSAEGFFDTEARLSMIR